jgi:hypothetical protein
MLYFIRIAEEHEEIENDLKALLCELLGFINRLQK